MTKIKGKKFNFEVIVGKKIDVAVLSSENDEYGDEARSMIYKYLPDVQEVGLPSSAFNNDVEGEDLKQIVFDIGQESWAKHVLYKDENGKIQEEK